MSSLDVRLIDEETLRLEPCPETKQEFRVFFTEAAFDRMIARGDSDATREIGGVLVGELLRDGAGPYLRIDDTIDALHAEEKGAELTFTHATWEHIHREMDGTYPEKRLVGWYHTHPGFGIFLSDRDRFIQKSFFNLSFQIAFVYDPKTREHGVFGWHEGEVWRARRYSIGAREQVWDGPRTAGDNPRDLPVRKQRIPETIGREHSITEPSRVHHELTLLSSVWPFVLCGALLVAGVLAGRWIGAESAQQTVMAEQREITEARAEIARLTEMSRQTDLFALLRDAFGHDAVRAPIDRALAEIESTLDVLPADAASGAGSAAAAGAGSGSSAGAVAPDPRIPQLVAALKASRERLLGLKQGHLTVRNMLTRLERVTRPGSELEALSRGLADQRVVLGAVYAELATLAGHAGENERARRLLDTAASVDPDNRARYQEQRASYAAGKP